MKKRYQKYFTEAVINVEKYDKQLVEIFDDIESKILYQDNSLLKIGWILTHAFQQFRIKFIIHTKHELQKHENYRYGLTLSETELDKYFTINIYCNPNIVEIQKNKNIYKEFVRRCIIFIKHELIHRLQLIDITDIKLKKTFATKRKEDLEYFSDIHELMAWSWVALEELRFSGYSDTIIRNKLRDKKFHPGESAILWKYLKLFPNDSKELRRFYKYIYMYLDGNFSDKEL